MHHGIGGGARVLNVRIDQSDAVAHAGVEQRAHEANASIAHRPGFDPGLVVLWPYQKRLEGRAIPHALGDSLSDGNGCEELVLDVQGMFGGSDGIQE